MLTTATRVARRLRAERHEALDHERLHRRTSRSCGPSSTARCAASSCRRRRPASRRATSTASGRCARASPASSSSRTSSVGEDALLPGVTGMHGPAVVPDAGALRHLLGRGRRGDGVLRRGAVATRRTACSSRGRSPATSSCSASSSRWSRRSPRRSSCAGGSAGSRKPSTLHARSDLARQAQQRRDGARHRARRARHPRRERHHRRVPVRPPHAEPRERRTPTRARTTSTRWSSARTSPASRRSTDDEPVPATPSRRAQRAELLVCAGLDPSGGAGLIADVRVASELGARPVGVVTALTVQNTTGVIGGAARAIREVVGHQLAFLLTDVEVRAVKIGMIGSARSRAAIASALHADAAPVVWDPIAASVARRACRSSTPVRRRAGRAAPAPHAASRRTRASCALPDRRSPVRDLERGRGRGPRARGQAARRRGAGQGRAPRRRRVDRRAAARRRPRGAARAADRGRRARARHRLRAVDRDRRVPRARRATSSRRAGSRRQYVAARIARSGAPGSRRAARSSACGSRSPARPASSARALVARAASRAATRSSRSSRDVALQTRGRLGDRLDCRRRRISRAPGAWWDALDGADAIVHLAGEPIAGKRWDARQKQLIRDSRVESARTIVEAIAALAPARGRRCS